MYTSFRWSSLHKNIHSQTIQQSIVSQTPKPSFCAAKIYIAVANRAKDLIQSRKKKIKSAPRRNEEKMKLLHVAMWRPYSYKFVAKSRAPGQYV
jgi:hypothetical protein